MPVDLDALSREVAAAGSDWALPGVRMLLDGHRAARVVVRNRIFVEATYRDLLYTPLPGDVPDLRDPVTVNSLLGNGEVVDYWGDGREWVVNHGEAYPTRTEAICRAWIAARGKR
jgi:hypothetical protein